MAKNKSVVNSVSVKFAELALMLSCMGDGCRWPTRLLSLPKFHDGSVSGRAPTTNGRDSLTALRQQPIGRELVDHECALS